MFSFKLALAAAVMLGPSTAANADSIVVRSTGAAAQNFPLGKQLPDDALISLGIDDVVTVLEFGGKRTFRGPGVFSIGSSNLSLSAGGSGISRMQGSRYRGSNRHLRNTAGSDQSVWNLSIAHIGNFCVVEGHRLEVWRAHRLATQLTIKSTDGRVQTVQWPVGVSKITWPADFATTEGTRYWLRIAAGPKWNEVRFRSVPAVSDSLAMAGVFIDRGCQQQLDLLVSQTAVATK
jgi:hypothetical protein